MGCQCRGTQCHVQGVEEMVSYKLLINARCIPTESMDSYPVVDMEFVTLDQMCTILARYEVRNCLRMIFSCFFIPGLCGLQFKGNKLISIGIFSLHRRCEVCVLHRREDED